MHLTEVAVFMYERVNIKLKFFLWGKNSVFVISVSSVVLLGMLMTENCSQIFVAKSFDR